MSLAPPPGSSLDSSSAPGRGQSQAATGTINLRLEVQRAGACSALLSMLLLTDDACLQACAGALYVLAQSSENRSAMQAAGVPHALQAVIAKGKLRPAQVTMRTLKDCEEAAVRIC